jgi:hypothetical protein
MAKKQGLPANQLIVETLQEKSFMKQAVYRKTEEAFGMVKEAAKALTKDLEKKVNSGDRKLEFKYQEKGDYEAMLTFAGDTLIFHMHSNVFNFDRSHFVWNSSYVKDDETRAYCGVINIYNFLTDSFRYNRESDLGYLIARIFINRENHYLVEGKRQLGFLYNDFPHAVIDQQAITNIIESSILYALDFDLLLPNYDQVKQVTISEIYAVSDALQQRTGKRLGFRFQADTDGMD